LPTDTGVGVRPRHILCPHCHNPIEVVKLTPHEEIVEK
jgi:hypothetical protein